MPNNPEPVAPVISPASPPASDLTNYGSMPTLTAEGAIENSPAFRSAVKKAWNISQENAMWKKPTEAGFTVDDQGNVSPVTQHTGGINPESAGGLPQDWESNTETALHTHPPMGIADPKPSQDDINIAKREGKPVMVQSRDGLYEIDGQGNVRLVFHGANWFKQTWKESQ
jgi:hypothetical protein